MNTERGTQKKVLNLVRAFVSLKRQINTLFYKRLLSSQNKAAVEVEIRITEPEPEYEKLIRDPYVLEFLNFLNYFFNNFVHSLYALH